MDEHYTLTAGEHGFIEHTLELIAKQFPEAAHDARVALNVLRQAVHSSDGQGRGDDVPSE